MNLFIKNPNLTKKILAVGKGGGGVRLKKVIFFFFQKNPSLKKMISFSGGEG